MVEKFHDLNICSAFRSFPSIIAQEIQRAFGYNTFENHWQETDWVDEHNQVIRDRAHFVANTKEWWMNFKTSIALLKKQIPVNLDLAILMQTIHDDDFF